MSVDPCGKCGQPHVVPSGIHAGKPSCAGHISGGRDRKDQAGRPCRNLPAPMLAKCKRHGAGNKVSRAASERKVAEAKVAATARKLIPDADQRTRITDPLAKLLELAEEADGFRESLRVLSNELENRIRYEAEHGGEQLRAEVATYRAAMRDVTDLLLAIARLNIDERLARIEERRIQIVISALTGGLNDAGVAADVKRSVITHVGRRLRAVAG